jgi:hypothetical protein
MVSKTGVQATKFDFFLATSSAALWISSNTDFAQLIFSNYC